MRHLRRHSIEIHALGRRPAGADVDHLAGPGDLAAIAAALKAAQPDYIFHLAGVAQAHDISTFYCVNTLYAANLIQAAEAAGLGHRPLLLVGTSAEYGQIAREQLPVDEETPARPLGHYGISKLAQTLIGETAGRQGRPVIIARPGNIIGPGMPEHISVQSFARQIAAIMTGRHEPFIEVGNLEAVRDFVDVDDVVATYWRLVREPGASGQVVNVCTGRGTQTGELLSCLVKLAGMPIEIRPDPARLKEHDVPVYVGDPTKLRRILGDTSFTPLAVTLENIHRNALEHP